MFSPVRWEESVRTMASQGVEVFLEVGPGKVLTKLLKRIIPTFRATMWRRWRDTGREGRAFVKGKVSIVTGGSRALEGRSPSFWRKKGLMSRSSTSSTVMTPSARSRPKG